MKTRLNNLSFLLKSQRGSTPLKLSIFLLCSLVSVSLLLGYFLLHGARDGKVRTVVIPRGSSLAQVANLLRAERVISNPLFVRLALRISGGATKVRAGEFTFKENMRALDAIMVLYFEEPIIHQVTIPEGWSIRQIATALSSTKIISEKRFLELTLNESAAKRYNLPGPSLEGYLFPDTYNFSKIDGEDQIIDRMVQNFKTHYDKEVKKIAETKKMSLLEVVTLASIIEKETGTSSERELVSSVFHNRLRKKMRLQSDPTTIYGIANFNGNLTKKDLHTPTPYNTYTIFGLPPGAIASPGLASLKAAVQPAQSNYLYFVSNNRGSHLFSETYAQHTRNVNSFQK